MDKRKKKWDEFIVKTRSFKENNDNSFKLPVSSCYVCIMSTFFFYHNFGSKATQKKKKNHAIVVWLSTCFHVCTKPSVFFLHQIPPKNAHANTLHTLIVFVILRWLLFRFNLSYVLVSSFFPIVKLKYKHVTFIRVHRVHTHIWQTHKIRDLNSRIKTWHPKKWRKL